MVDMPLMAATAWAQAHAAESKDPVAFGAKVARVYLAAEAIKYHGCKDTFSELEAAILREAGLGEPTPPKNGGDAEAEGAAQPHKPTPPSPCGGVAALYEAMQQGAADAVAATQRAEEARSKQNAQWDAVREVLGAPIGPAAPIDSAALLATSGVLSPVAQRSRPAGRLASIFSALRRLLPRRPGRCDTGDSR